jgi:spore germination cell wall hydrolase CwlJ-like protein
MIEISKTKVFSAFVLFFGILMIAGNFFLPLEEEIAEEETPEQVAKAVDPKQLACLAANIFYEAGSESLNGQAAVARVVMNRVQHGFASNPCKVVYQTSLVTRTNQETNEEYKVKSCQFSWVCEGKGNPNKNDPRYVRAEKIAYEVLAYDAYSEVLPTSALFFHNLTVDPFWPYKQVAKIGNHVFYSKAKKAKKKSTDIKDA